jgi:hypothetical protein
MLKNVEGFISDLDKYFTIVKLSKDQYEQAEDQYRHFLDDLEKLGFGDMGRIDTFDVDNTEEDQNAAAGLEAFLGSYDKVITYTYTTDEGTGHYLTATADYDQTLVYSAIYDGEGVFLYWIYNGVHYEQLPTTHEVTESMYEPLMKQAVSAMPSTGYYVYLCPVGMTVVISGLTATVSGGKALVMGLGIFKNVATNFIGAPGQAVIAQAFAQAIGDMQGIIENLKHMGSFKATDIDCENMPKVCGYPLVVEGAGAPSIVPRFVGQRYHDTTNNKCYEAFAVTNSTANWVLLN